MEAERPGGVKRSAQIERCRRCAVVPREARRASSPNGASPSSPGLPAAGGLPWDCDHLETLLNPNGVAPIRWSRHSINPKYIVHPIRSHAVQAVREARPETSCGDDALPDLQCTTSLALA